MSERCDIPDPNGTAREPAAVAGGSAETAETRLADEVYVAAASFAQQRLWLVERQQPGLATYNVPLALRLRGPLDAGRLAGALAALGARHETLRTALVEEDGEPVQQIWERLVVRLPRIDLTGLAAPAAREREALGWIEREARRPFELARPPLVRALLFRLAASEHLLLVNLHHAVTDAWSLGILGRDLFEIYRAATRGEAPRLPELAVQYADYAAWQRQWLTGEALKRELAPWRQRLAGAPAALPLPADRPRPLGPGVDGAILHFALPAALAAALPRLGREMGATLFMVVVAAWSALLARLSGQSDLVVGAPVANRQRVETENLVGFFVNSLALRCDLAGDPAWREIVARVGRVAVEALAHQDLPFELLVAALKPERQLNLHPLFQVTCGLQRPALTAFGAAGLDLTPVTVHSGTAKFDLHLEVVGEEGGDLTGFCEYSTARFDRATVRRLVAQLLALLGAAAAAPERRLSELPLLGAAERQQVIVEWNEAAPDPDATPAGWRRDEPAWVPLAERFARQVARRPDAVAVSAAEASLTYGELDRRAAALARRLQRLGRLGVGAGGAESVVGVAMERGPALIVALVGIAQAGAVYLPLDPSHPPERLRFMLADAGARVLLVDGGNSELEALSGGGENRSPLAVLRMSAQAGGDPLPAGAAGDAGWARQAESLVYVIYTSGSTGQPKGVAVPERAVVRLVEASNYVSLGPSDVVVQAANASFDAATFEIWGALLNGARLLILPREVTLAPELLARRLREGGATVLFLTTALVHWLASAAPGGLASLRQLLFGGEAVDPSRIAELLAGGGPARLTHVYGPTENTTFSSWAPVLEVPAGAATLPIGLPIRGSELHLLDGDLAPVPIGVTGEIYLGGLGLARGYLGQPALTAERFVPSPLGVCPGGAPGARDCPGGAPGARLYRTGDLGRRRADGAVEFVGRVDAQVKIRGFRIEPAEVEAALGSHPAVAECVVVARRTGGTGELALAAYVVPRQAAGLALGALREHLVAKLPDYMVPAWFVELPRLPRNANGKLDRGALPEPGERGSGRHGQAPHTPVEELLAGIWAAVLQIERVGAADNFFDLGGSSLTASRVISQVRAVLEVELPGRALYEAPVLGDLAKRIEQLLAAAAGLALPPIVPAPRSGAVPLSFAQQRLWFVDQLAHGESPFYNIATAWSLGGALSPAALAAALSAIQRRHEALRTTFAIGAAGRPVQVIHRAVPMALPLADLAALPALLGEAEARRLVHEEAVRPFSLTRGPLLRARLLRLAAERHALSLDLHHCAGDGWSLGVLLRELATLYGAALAGRRSPLAALPVQYADFALWQRQWLADARLEVHLDYWRRQLDGAPPALALPADHPRPAVAGFRGGHVAVELAAATVERLRTAARGQRATLFMVLLGGFAAWLRRASGQGDLCIGTPVANRGRAEIEGLIGFFVNLLVLRIDLSGGPSFASLIARVRETALAAYTHQELPFERLVEELQPVRDLSRNPLFQVSFSLASLPRLELPGVTATPLDVGFGAELFDLSLLATETRRGLGLRLTWNRDLFEPATGERLARQLEQLLAAMAAEPSHAVDTLPMLSDAERRQTKVAAPAAPASAPAAAVQVAAGEAATPPAPDGPREGAGRSRQAIEDLVAGIWRELLEIQEVDLDESFFDLGGHSMLLAVVRVKIQEALGCELSMVDMFNYPTVRTLADHVSRVLGGGEIAAPAPAAQGDAGEVAAAARPNAIAIVGMSGRFPGARDLDELWRNLRDGIDSISFFGPEGASWAPPEGSTVHLVPAGGVIEGAELWDAEFFGYSPREAELMDPQHRIFLECAWQALESAGYDSQRYPGAIGVFGGAGKRDYLLRVAASGAMAEPLGRALASFGNDSDFLTTRVSYELGLEGPSLDVQTACSTSLVAVHLACQSLLAGDCDLALAGGVSIAAEQRAGYLYREGGILSPDGRCRPFAAAAAGTVDSDGVGIVVLKRLRDALAEGDTVHAVILGSAVNNDGGGKVGFTAPRAATQTRLIRTALARAGVAAESISYVEAHGTGTALGDPIEVAALTAAFRAETEARGFCALGSVKSNLGHCNSAAAVAGLIKTVLALEHRQLPPSLHCEAPDPALDLAASPFAVVERLRDWETGGRPRRAGVSSFGVGGTNAHAVLEEAPPPAARPAGAAERPWQLLILSARSASALAAAAARLAADLTRRGPDLADAAYTLQVGRRSFEHRRVVLCRDLEGAVAGLGDRPDGERTAAAVAPRRSPPVAFLLPGQGAQQAGMGAGLYRDEPVFRAELERCCELLAPHCAHDLRQVLLAGNGAAGAAAAGGGANGIGGGLDATEIVQPALFAVEYALARTWMAWGVQPVAFLGHSLGEYVAACLAGVLALEDALALVAARGRLVAELPRGAMLAVPLGAEELRPLLDARLDIAAENGAHRTVVAGPDEAVAALEERLARRQLAGRRLATSHAFHSAMVEPILQRFADAVARVPLQPPLLPFLSNVSGTWIKPEEATDPAYWVRQLRQTVRFGTALAQLPAGPPPLLLEVGPGRSLAGIARQQLAGRPVAGIFGSLPRPGEAMPEQAVMLLTLGRMWLAGVAADWAALHAGQGRRRVPLPTYPFERRRHWIEVPATVGTPWPLGVFAPGPVSHRAAGAAGGEAADAHGAPTDMPAAGAGEVAGDAAGTPPRLPVGVIESALAELWSELLRVPRVQAEDDFFELGGDSLIAITLAARLRERFGVTLPVRQVVEHPTLAGLAAAIAAAQASVRPAAERPAERQRRPLPEAAVELQAGSAARPPLFLIHPAGGHVLCYQPLARRLGAEQPVFGLEAAGPDALVPARLDRLEDIAARHVAAMRAIAPAGPYLLGGWSAGGGLAFEMARQLDASGQPVGLVALLDTWMPAETNGFGDLDLLLWKAASLGLPLSREQLAARQGFAAQVEQLAAIAAARRSGAEAERDSRLLELELWLLRAFLHYRPQPLARPLVAFRCTGNGAAAHPVAPFPTADVVSAWTRFAPSLTVYDIAADHAALLNEPWVGIVADRLRRHLDVPAAAVSAMATHG